MSTTTLTLTSSADIPALNHEPRLVHNSGVWFTDPAGEAYRMDFAAWVDRDSPEQIGLTGESVVTPAAGPWRDIA